MNAERFRQLFEYHFTANRVLWERCIVPLSQADFVRPVPYSVGSVRNQVVHMMTIDDTWFSGLRGVDLPDVPDYEAYQDREAIRDRWDAVEVTMRGYLAGLTDEALEQPAAPPDELMQRWQVLFHVLNHGTDHRAQLLSLLNSLGVTTFAQDYFFYVFNDL